MVEKEDCWPYTRDTRFWQRVSAAMSLMLTATHTLQWLVLPLSGLALHFVNGIQILVLCVGIFSIFRWAALYERGKKSRAPS
jgi:hypothetical protein